LGVWVYYGVLLLQGKSLGFLFDDSYLSDIKLFFWHFLYLFSSSFSPHFVLLSPFLSVKRLWIMIDQFCCLLLSLTMMIMIMMKEGVSSLSDERALAGGSMLRSELTRLKKGYSYLASHVVGT
jgi:hypothetical protein